MAHLDGAAAPAEAGLSARGVLLARCVSVPWDGAIL
eukprot:CAMPEP_0204365486 /NCGR_PEP_ID=MMETSP0469-20131031/41948_1 /ASSEMBLY_ACC=CAM_ASM_000384 /TAXON_ID=2969 /ORGANISM="Oxyrrhis marina" /LENGTH=35 /DNA_ID= /DNA_START= /DNA_END= /DNA_ORIENTATION=